MSAPPLLRVRIRNYASLRTEIQNFQRIQRGSFTQLVKETLMEMRDYAEAITHRRSGALASSHIVVYDSAHQRGFVTVDPGIMTRRSGGRMQSVIEYAGPEHARGGSHAYYERTLREYGDVIVRRGVAAYLGRLPGGIHQ